MKNIAILLTILICLFSCEKVSNENYLDYSYSIPDNNFRLFLEEEGLIEVNSSTKEITLTQDGSDLSELECRYREIRSIEGVSIFPNLSSADFRDNLIEQLPSSFGEIEALNLSSNLFTEIIFEPNDKIKYVTIHHCYHLQKIDLSKLSRLEEIYSVWNYSLAELIPSDFIYVLQCDESRNLPYLNLENCYNLSSLTIRSSDLSNSLVLPTKSTSERFKNIRVGLTRLKSIDLSGLNKIRDLELYRNSLTELYVPSSALADPNSYFLECGLQIDPKGNPIILSLTLDEDAKKLWIEYHSKYGWNENVILK